MNHPSALPIASPWRLMGSVIAVVSVFGMAISMTVPLVSLTLEARESPGFAIGIMAAVPALGILIISFAIPKLTELLRGHVLVVSAMVLCAASTLLLLAFPGYGAWIILRLFTGLAIGCLFAVAETWINLIAPEEKRGVFVAVYTTALSLFFATGPSLLAWVGPTSHQAYWVAAILAVLPIPIILAEQRVLPSFRAHAGLSVGRFVATAPTLAGAMLLFAFIDGSAFAMLPVFVVRNGYPDVHAAMFVTALVAGSTLAQIPIGWLADRFDAHKLLVLCGVFIVASAWSLLIVVGSGWMLAMALIILGAVSGGVFTLTLTILGRRFRGADLIVANAAFGVLWGIGNISGPLITGGFISLFGADGVPWAVVLAAGLFLAVLFFRHGIWPKSAGI
jgi:MFS family permease